MSKCKQCGKDLGVSKSNNPRQWCPGSACRMAYNRARPEQINPNTPKANIQPEQGGTITTPDKRSSILGDPQGPKSGLSRIKDSDWPMDKSRQGVVTVDQPTSQCYKDSGIPLPGDQGYRGVCKLIDGQLDPARKRMSLAEQKTRYAHA